MSTQDKDDLFKWCRHLEIDESNDGIGEIEAHFCIRYEQDRMRKIFKEMTKRDAADILEVFLDDVWFPCDDYFEDWKDEDSKFGVYFWWDDEHEHICMHGTFRAS